MNKSSAVILAAGAGAYELIPTLGSAPFVRQTASLACFSCAQHVGEAGY